MKAANPSKVPMPPTRHLNERDTLKRLIEEYRENRTLGNVLASVETLLDIDAQEKATRDFEAWEDLLKQKST